MPLSNSVMSAQICTDWMSLGAGQVVDALHAAGTDERVKGVIAHIGSTQNFSGLAQIQELRDAVTEFRCCVHPYAACGIATWSRCMSDRVMSHALVQAEGRGEGCYSGVCGCLWRGWRLWNHVLLPGVRL